MENTKKRLLFFIYTLLSGGAERVMVIICNELVERGYEIHLATNLQLPFAFQLDQRIELHGLIIGEQKKSKGFLDYFKLNKNIRRISKKVNPDIIISFNHILNVHVLMSTVGLRIPVISSEHITFEKKHLLHEYIIRYWINRLAAKIIILTQHDYKFLGNKLPSKTVIENPLSFPIFKHNNNKQRRKNILAVGNIDRWEHKGFDNLIKIWSKLSNQYPDWVLEIAGNGSIENFNYLKQLATDYHVLSKIKFLGLQKDIDKLMQKSSIFVLTSRYEGFPMVLCEAMSQGCACISFDCISGPGEIISNNISGMLIRNQDFKEMEEQLNNLIENENLRNLLSKNALIEIERLSPNYIVDKWINVFNELTN